MKRLLLLLALALILVLDTYGNCARVLNVSFCRAIENGDRTLIIYAGELFEVAESGAAIRLRAYQKAVVAPDAQQAFRITNPNAVLWSSATTPIVDGRIICVGADSIGTVWMMNSSGAVSSFDGHEWITTSPQSTDKFQGHYTQARFLKDRIRYFMNGSIIDFILNNRTYEVRCTHKLLCCGIRMDENGVVMFSDGVNHGFVDVDAGKIEHHKATNFEAFCSGTYCGATVKPDDSRFVVDTYVCNEGRVHEREISCAMKRMQIDTLSTQLQQSLLRIAFDTIPHYGFGVEDVAVDVNGTVYVATYYGVVVLPDTSMIAGKIQDTPPPQMKIFPNSAAISASLELNGMDDYTVIRIVNLMGVVVRSLSSNSRQIQLDLAGLPAGMYTVIAQGRKTRTSKQLQVW